MVRNLIVLLPESVSVERLHLILSVFSHFGKTWESTFFQMVLPPTIRQLLRSPLPSNLPKSTTTTVSGWIKSIRKQKNISFAVITDGSSTKGLQAVLVKGDEGLLRRYLLCFLYPYILIYMPFS